MSHICITGLIWVNQFRVSDLIHTPCKIKKTKNVLCSKKVRKKSLTQGIS